MNSQKRNTQICEKTFEGGLKLNNEPLTNKKTYRFKLVKESDYGYICIPEYYSEKTNTWNRTLAEWNITDIMDSESIHLDISSFQVIFPTEEVWDEVREILKSNTL